MWWWDTGTKICRQNVNIINCMLIKMKIWWVFHYLLMNRFFFSKFWSTHSARGSRVQVINRLAAWLFLHIEMTLCHFYVAQIISRQPHEFHFKEPRNSWIKCIKTINYEPNARKLSKKKEQRKFHNHKWWCACIRFVVTKTIHYT